MSKYREFLIAAGKRLALTFLHAFTGVLVATGTGLIHVDTLRAAAAAGFAAVLASVQGWFEARAEQVTVPVDPDLPAR